MQISRRNEHIHISERARIFHWFCCDILNFRSEFNFCDFSRLWTVCLASCFFTSTAKDNISVCDSRFAALATLAFSKFHSLFLCFTPVLWHGALLIPTLLCMRAIPTLLIEFALRVCVLKGGGGGIDPPPPDLKTKIWPPRDKKKTKCFKWHLRGVIVKWFQSYTAVSK